MTDTLALVHLYETVKARFELEATNATNHFGWRESTAQKPNNTLVWMPGDPSGALGTLAAPSHPGRNPRPLFTLHELFTVEITAIDLQNAENELAQYVATRLLYDAWLRAVYLASRARFAVQSATWVKDKIQRSHGATIRVVVALEAMVPDAPLTTAPADTRAAVTVAELNVTQAVAVPDAEEP